MHVRRTIGLFVAFLMVAAARPEADPRVIDRIVAEGKFHNQVMSHLRYLTKTIGPRLTGSPQMDKAYAWTAARFKEYGCKNVHLEEWGEWPVGFERGRRQAGRMVEPIKRDFEFTTRSWTPGTKGNVKGEAILAPLTMEAFEKTKARLKGAWVVSRDNEEEPEEGVVEAVNDAGIAGRVFGARTDRVVTSGRWNVDIKSLPKFPRVTVRRSDMDSILEKLDAGRKVVLEFSLDNRFVKGPRKNYNVIADIPGVDKPDEMIIISGHLDSWDGPGSQGAQDNGTGTCVTLEAARILCKAGARPSRTIRFILWTGEEEGLFGSRDYIKRHADELPKISAVFVDDGGTNYEGGLDCTAEMEPILKKAFEPAMRAFPDMPMTTRVVSRLPRSGDSDHHPFNTVGVPGFFWYETGRGDYGFIHHTQNDKLEYAIPEYLIQSSTNSAAVAYILSCEPELLPREKPETPAPGEKTGGLLAETAPVIGYAYPG